MKITIKEKGCCDNCYREIKTLLIKEEQNDHWTTGDEKEFCLECIEALFKQPQEGL